MAARFDGGSAGADADRFRDTRAPWRSRVEKGTAGAGAGAGAAGAGAGAAGAGAGAGAAGAGAGAAAGAAAAAAGTTSADAITAAVCGHRRSGRQQKGVLATFRFFDECEKKGSSDR